MIYLIKIAILKVMLGLKKKIWLYEIDHDVNGPFF